eukprot:1144838-Pelagomonas_calceolata.AAC.3
MQRRDAVAGAWVVRAWPLLLGNINYMIISCACAPTCLGPSEQRRDARERAWVVRAWPLLLGNMNCKII